MIFDGVARRQEEAPILDSALHFYANGTTPHIVFLDTHPDAAKQRLIKRGRFDDTHEKIDARFKWFESDVVPSVRYFEKQSHCRFVSVNGDGTVEEVFAGVKRAVGLS
jgi:adenylate kinase family enzyme